MLEPLDDEPTVPAVEKRTLIKEMGDYEIWRDGEEITVWLDGKKVYDAFDAVDAGFWIEEQSGKGPLSADEAPGYAGDDFDTSEDDDAAIIAKMQERAKAQAPQDARMTISYGQALAICRAFNAAFDLVREVDDFSKRLNEQFKGVEFSVAHDGTLNSGVPDFDELSLEPHVG